MRFLLYKRARMWYNLFCTKEVKDMKLKAVFFDLDGTLLDTKKDLAVAVNHALAGASLPTRDEAEIERFLGNGIGLLVRRAAGGDCTNELFSSLMTSFTDYYFSHLWDFTRPYGGVPELLADLRARGLKIAVISNKRDEAAARLIGATLPGLIDLTVGERPDIPRKPDPAPVILAMDELGVKKEECILVGDSESDVEAARAAGVPFVGVTWGYRSRETLVSRGAVRFIDRPEELKELLSQVEL